MTKQTINKFIPIIAVLIIGAISFYTGMRFERSSSVAAPRANFATMSQEERQARMANGGFNGTQRNGTRPGGNGSVFGEVLSKDAKSITVKLRDGGSKIVFLSDTTKITKSVDGSLADLTIGAQVTTIGTANADGSITAQSVQLRNDVPQKQN